MIRQEAPIQLFDLEQLKAYVAQFLPGVEARKSILKKPQLFIPDTYKPAESRLTVFASVCNVVRSWGVNVPNHMGTIKGGIVVDISFSNPVAEAK